MPGRDRERHQPWIEERHQQALGSRVHAPDIPQAVEQHGAIGLLLGQQQINRPAHRRHRQGIERRRGIGSGIAGTHQERVFLAQLKLQRAGQEEHHLPTRLRLAGLHAAEMSRRDVGQKGQLFLTQTTTSAMFAQQRGEGDRHGWAL